MGLRRWLWVAGAGDRRGGELAQKGKQFLAQEAMVLGLVSHQGTVSGVLVGVCVSAMAT